MPTTLYMIDIGQPTRSVILTIRQLGLDDIKLRPVNTFEDEHLTPEFVAKNPSKIIPFLDDDGFVINESRAICTYLVESKAPGKIDLLGGTDPKRRAIVNQRLQFDMGILFPKISQIYSPLLRGLSTTVEDWKKKELIDVLTKLDTFYLKKGEYVAGEKVTIADFVILASISTALALGLKLEKFPTIADWYKRCQRFAGFDEDHAGAQKLGSLVRGKLGSKANDILTIE